jgi:hypothetical protein|tara:strand:- start:399 stop:908 length:510 start_codon:yes stop_codon:yes gene_type:complete
MLKLSKYLFIVFIGINSQLVAAQPALFENSVLTIPTGAAIVNGEPIYYNDIQLISDIEGNFSLLAAQRSNLVSVDSVSLLINITQPIPDQVSFAVTGHKSIPCVELQAPAVFQDEFTFTVALAETTLGPAESCIAVLDPFETIITLPIQGLASGTYSVTVNGIESSFSR